MAAAVGKRRESDRAVRPFFFFGTHPSSTYTHLRERTRENKRGKEGREIQREGKPVLNTLCALAQLAGKQSERGRNSPASSEIETGRAQYKSVPAGLLSVTASTVGFIYPTRPPDWRTHAAPIIVHVEIKNVNAN